MNNTTAAVMAHTPTAVLIEAARRLMDNNNRNADEDRSLVWTLEELMNRDPAMRAAMQAAVA